MRHDECLNILQVDACLHHAKKVKDKWSEKVQVKVVNVEGPDLWIHELPVLARLQFGICSHAS